MDIGDISDPNLDGDFQTLLEVRQKRKAQKNERKSESNNEKIVNSEEINRLIQAFEQDNLNDEANLQDSNSNGWKDIPTTPSDDSVDSNLRAQLFQAALSNDVETLRKLRHGVSVLGITFSHTSLRDVTDKSTVLHEALRNESWDSAKYLIRTCDVTFLSECFDVKIRNLPSKKSSLHILSEIGNVELAKLLLEQYRDDAKRLEVLSQSVLTELEGQRPRELSSMHIAALKGHTSLVELYHRLGVNVNITNTKNDTPILWAARGNHIDTARRLIQMGARLDLENDKGSTPLYWAVRYGFAELVEVLINEGKANIHQERKLGLVSPIVLASALGYENIVEILLNNGADANTKIQNDQTALHAASAEGNDGVVVMLLTKGKAEVNHQDSNGNTALLFAAKGGHVRTMKILLAKGAKINTINKAGQSLWDFAMQHEDSDFLKNVAKLYYRFKTQKANTSSAAPKLVFRVGRTPLHSSAAAGDIQKIRCLLDLGADPKSLDLNGNTFYHVAAINNHPEILKEFIDEADIDAPNTDGDTALHLAARHGNLMCVMVLLQKCKLDVRNKRAMTALHGAVESDTSSVEVVRALVEVVVKASNWSLVDARDTRGNTALHTAARLGKYELFADLCHLNATLKNNNGDTPFHLAARSGVPNCLETMLSIFNRPEKGFNVDQLNGADESALYECVRMADGAGIQLLVSCGADLSIINNHGNTPLHLLIQLTTTGLSPQQGSAQTLEARALSVDQTLQVYGSVVACSTRWWCMKKDLQQPAEASELYYSHLREAVTYLTSEVYNHDGQNVLSMATTVTAIPLLNEILNTPNVYRFRELDDYVYDVTHLTPETVPTIATRRSISMAKKVDEYGDKRNLLMDDVTVSRISLDSCLDIVISMHDEVTAAKILDINPFRTLVRDYWSTYQWIFAILIFLHFTYMVLFTVFVMPTYNNLTERFNCTVSGECTIRHNGYGFFLIWPILIIMFEIYTIIEKLLSKCKRQCRKSKRRSTKRVTPAEIQASSIKKASVGESFWVRYNITLLGMPYRVLKASFDYLSHVTALAFAALVITWYFLFLCYTTERVYVEVLALVLLLGWMFTISFTKGFEELHTYTIMLKYIVIRDITKFILIYIFVLLGVGMAFNTLFQISTDIVNDYPTPWHTLYGTFNLMLGLGSMLDEAGFDETYSRAGGSPTFIKIVYIFYVLMANVILLSLIIAMMTDTYTEIKSKEGLAWRVGSLRLALRVERAMPCLKKALRVLHISTQRITRDSTVERWVIKVSAREVETLSDTKSARPENEDVTKAIQSLEGKIDKLFSSQLELMKQMEVLYKQTQTMSNDVAGRVPVTRRPVPSLHSVAMRLRERPFTPKLKSASQAKDAATSSDKDKKL